MIKLIKDLETALLDNYNEESEIILNNAKKIFMENDFSLFDDDISEDILNHWTNILNNELEKLTSKIK